MFDRGLDVRRVPRLRIPTSGTCQSEFHPSPAQTDRSLNLLDRHASFHGVENSLRAALRADPDSKTTHLRQRLHHLWIQAVGARNAFERELDPRRFNSSAY